MSDGSHETRVFAGESTTRVYRLGPIGRVLALLAGVALIVVLFIVLLPVAIITLGIGLLLVLAWYVRMKWLIWRAKAQAPNGVLDGRRNVRVVDPGAREGE